MEALPLKVYDTFTRTLESLLPEAWRHDLVVTRNPLGFTLQFSDAKGRRHMVEARAAQPDAPALVKGHVLAYSYTHIDPALDVDSILEAYRELLTAVAAREDELLPMLAVFSTPTEPLGATTPQGALIEDPFSAPSDAPAGLVTILQEVLPEAWRQRLVVTPWPGGFGLAFVDDEGHRHAFDVRRLAPHAPAFVSGETLGYSYTLVDPALAEAAVIEKYRETLTALAAREAEILRWVDLPVVDADPEANAETQPAKTVDYPDQAPAMGALPERVIALLPEEWRASASVVSIMEGFAVGFTDATGVRHMLEARLLDAKFPALLRGERFGFSYLKVDPALDETLMVPRYREVLQDFLAHEDEFVADLNPAA